MSDALRDTTAPIRSVLFVCNQNAVRSPMAEAILKSRTRGLLYVASAGLISGMADSFVSSVMQERGYSVKNHKSKSINEAKPEDFSLVIALTDESHDRLQKAGWQDRTKLEHWSVTDPTKSGGNREAIMEAYRTVARGLETQIDMRFPDYAKS